MLHLCMDNIKGDAVSEGTTEITSSSAPQRFAMPIASRSSSRHCI
jgi:hypothetical protein